MVLESERTGASVYLSMAHLPASTVLQRFPGVADLCRRAGLDLTTDRLPVGPAAHYLMGGIATDIDGRTSLPGLFAAGEVAMTGVHGANRLASNSLLEGLVFGARAGRAMRDWPEMGWPAARTSARRDPTPAGRPLALSLSEDALRDRMWSQAGVFRDRDRLTDASAALARPWQELLEGVAQGCRFDASTWRTASLLTVAQLVVRAALRRTESRGAHWRTDFPERNDLDWKHSVNDVRM
jgi:L-aspartate oxidase